MKTRLWLLALLGMVLLHSPMAWADEVYVVAGGRGVGTRITSLPYEIKNPGFYYLGGNLTYSGTSNAIYVSTDDVTLDLMGFSLSNGGAPGSTYGICMSGCTNVEIRNGTVRGFNNAIYENPSGNQHRVLNVRATGNDWGIILYGNNHLIKNCNGSYNTFTGLCVSSASGTGAITGCVACNNNTGIAVGGPVNVLGNTALNNSWYNFYFTAGGTAILVDGNSAFGLAPNYYFVSGSSGVKWGTNAGTP